jgi:SAM-dependent methyltransferase/uncharacterized protein YbaR (Trm112 family)
VCRANGRDAEPLIIAKVIDGSDDAVREGVLHCPSKLCLHEYPIIDGIPIIVADIRSYIASQLADIRARRDLSAFTESMLGDCAGSGSDFDRTRYQLSTYCRGHWGDRDPGQPGPREGRVADLLERAAGLMDPAPTGAWLDVGCSVGRATFELAAHTSDLVLGLDMNFAMLRVAHDIAATGRVRHPLRRVGLVYDVREFEVEAGDASRVDFWAADATALPLADAAVQGALSLNLIDCTNSPLGHLLELGRVIAPGGTAAIASPYDWSLNATTIEGWLGGHSQRADDHGSSVAAMRRFLTDTAPAEADPHLRIAAEVEEVPWHVYVHERATMTYLAHLIVANRS